MMFLLMPPQNIKLEFINLAKNNVTFFKIKKVINKQTLYEDLRSSSGLEVLKNLRKLKINQIKIDNISYEITKIKVTINNLRNKEKILLKNFQKENSILNKLKKLNKTELTIDGEVFSFKVLLAIKN